MRAGNCRMCRRSRHPPFNSSCGGILLAMLSLVLERASCGTWMPSGIGALLFLIFGRQHRRVQPVFLATENGRAISRHHRAIRNSDHLQCRRDVVSPRNKFRSLNLWRLIVLSAVILVLRIPADDDRYLDIRPSNQRTHPEEPVSLKYKINGDECHICIPEQSTYPYAKDSRGGEGRA